MSDKEDLEEKWASRASSPTAEDELTLPKTEETLRGESSVMLGPGCRCGQSWGQLQHQEAVWGGVSCAASRLQALFTSIFISYVPSVSSYSRRRSTSISIPVSQVCAQHLPTAHCEKHPIPQWRTLKLSGRCLSRSFCASLKILICLQTEEYWLLAGPLLPESHLNRPSRDCKAVRRWGLINFPNSLRLANSKVLIL